MVARGPALKASGMEAEERLLVEAAQKDPTRFSELYEANFERVYAYIARRVRGREEAEDLTSDVFHRALAALPRFEWRGVPFAAWLLKIGANLIADRLKRSAQELESHSLGSNVDNPADRSFEEAEHRAQLFRLVDQLPVNQRRVILLRFAGEKSIREIAQELGRTEGAVKQLQFRGLENLRARMSESNG
jgi:RNA polymerase sigma-70 factor, ECF subfamily